VTKWASGNGKLDEFFSSSKLFIVAGKGGVGKTTVAASLARLATTCGRRTLLVDVERKRGIAAAFGVAPLTYDEQVLVPADALVPAAALLGRTITPDDALVEWLGDHGLRRLGDRMVATGLVDIIATATPGIRDLLVLAKVKQLVVEGAYDTVVLDTPASGHAITFLRSPLGLAEAVRSGPIKRQSDEVLNLLHDPARTRVVLVTLAEETPVNELVETAYQLEESVGVALGPVVVNGLVDAVPLLTAAVRNRLSAGEQRAVAEALEFETARFANQSAQCERLADVLPLPQLRLPERAGVLIDRDGIFRLADILGIALSNIERVL
jgi:anion-transporting  ArsA/GET3 family ATPase